ncbi:AEC family transporter [Mycoplasma simbae]|uniref:AEC family transporter n=1 Tax=Mycoplasma simbae TaxID=36744 RepID=UPI0006924CDF|nr:AEC family transporter [Mycoplasma simbae]
MSSLTLNTLKEQAWILLISIAFYTLMSLISWLWIKYDWKLPQFIKNANNKSFVGYLASTSNGDVPRERVMVMWMLLVFGMTTTFGIPVLSEFYRGSDYQSSAIISVSMFNLPQRIFLYTYCLSMITGLKINKNNIGTSIKKLATNSTLLITIIGFFLWVSQLIPGLGGNSIDTNAALILPDGSVVNSVKKATFGTNFMPIYFDAQNQGYIYDAAGGFYNKTNIVPSGWMNFKVTMPYLYNVATMLASLCTPIVWLTVGMKMGESSLKETFKDKYAWFYTIIKIFVIPAIMLGIMKLFNVYDEIGKVPSLSMIVAAATPPGAVPTALCLSYNKAPTFTARASALSTIVSLAMLPIWILISELVFV